jgi:hypothetical protein
VPEPRFTISLTAEGTRTESVACTASNDIRARSAV